MATGIMDKVAILGMGCSAFGERWDADAEDLMVEAFQECLADAGIDKDAIQAAWLGCAVDPINVGNSALHCRRRCDCRAFPCPASKTCVRPEQRRCGGQRMRSLPARATLRWRWASRKLKDTGYGGLPIRTKGLVNDLWMPYGSAPGTFAQLAEAYSAKHRVPMEDLKRGMAHVSWKSHENGARNPKAHLRKRVTIDQILNAPMISEPLGLLDWLRSQ